MDHLAAGRRRSVPYGQRVTTELPQNPTQSAQQGHAIACRLAVLQLQRASSCKLGGLRVEVRSTYTDNTTSVHLRATACSSQSGSTTMRSAWTRSVDSLRQFARRTSNPFCDNFTTDSHELAASTKSTPTSRTVTHATLAATVDLNRHKHPECRCMAISFEPSFRPRGGRAELSWSILTLAGSSAHHNGNNSTRTPKVAVSSASNLSIRDGMRITASPGPTEDKQR